MKAINFTLFVVPFLSTHFFVAVATAGQIGIGAFSPSAALETFDALGASTRNHTTPLIIGNDAYDADDQRLASSDKFGFTIGRSGVAIGNNAEASNASVGFIEIELGTPALRAGMYVGFQFPWSANAQFFNASDVLLGTVTMSGIGGDNSFAGWQADVGIIQRIRVENNLGNNSRLIVDDLIQEVPEPNCVQLLLSGSLIAGWFALRRDKRTACLRF